MTGSVKDIDKRTRQSLIWYMSVPFILHFIRLGSSIWLARILMPSDFGILGIVTVLFFYCDLLTSFGLSNAIIQRKNVKITHYTSYFSFNVFISSILFLTFQFSASSIADFFNEPQLTEVLKVFSIMFLLSACIAAPQASLKRELDFKILSLIEGVGVIVSIVVSLLLALNGFGYWSMVCAMILSQFIILIFSLHFSVFTLKFGFKLSSFKQLLNFGVWDFFWGQAVLLSENLDKMIIAKVLGTTQLGLYDKALGFAQMPNIQIARRLSTVSFSTFSRVQNDLEEMEKHFSKVMTLNATICFPIFLGLVAVSENFTLVLLGEKWSLMVSSLAILSFAFLIASITNPITSINLACGAIKQQTIIRFVCVFILGVGLLFVAKLGIEAASYMLVGFYVLQFLASYWLLNYKFKFRWSKLFELLWAPLLSGSIMFLSVNTFVEHFFVDERLFNLMFSIVIGGVVYIALFFILPCNNWLYLKQGILRKLSLVNRSC